MKALLSACLFVALLSPVSSYTEPLTCMACYSRDCSGISFDSCRPGTRQKACYSKIVDFPVEGEVRKETIHHKLGCMRPQDCHPINYTASLPDGGYIHMEVKCCHKSVCNKPITVPKQKDRALNGMQCPGCLIRYPNASEPCSSDTTVGCRGQENKCIAYTGRLKKPGLYYSLLSFKGCATKDLCDLLMGATEQGSDLLKPSDTTEAECSPAEYPVAE